MVDHIRLQNNSEYVFTCRVTFKQQVFRENLVSGMNQSSAYRFAYSTCKSASAARVGASRLLTNANICQKLEELQKLTQTEITLTWQRKREILANIAEDPNSTPAERIAAIRQDCQMSGHDKPPKLEASFDIEEILKDLPNTTGLPLKERQ